jgi:hypothetical protein
MLDVASQDANELVTTDDQQLVEALPADCPHPTLGDGIRVGHPHGRADDLGPGRAPHVVEHPGELGVPVADQKPPCHRLITQAGQQIAGLLGDQMPVGVGSPARCTRRLPNSMTNSTYTRRSKTVSMVKKSHAKIPSGLLAQERSPARGGTPRRGAMPLARRILRIELADTPAAEAQQLALDPLVAHRGFSRASRTTNSCTSSETGGRPLDVDG